MGFYYCPITPSPVGFSIQIFRRGLKFLKFSSMNQYIKLTIWYFFLKICWGYCPHSWLLGCPRPAFLLIARFLNIIINKHSKHLLYVHLLDCTPMFTCIHFLTISLKTLVFHSSLMLYVRELKKIALQ